MCQEDVVAFFLPGAENAVHDIQILFRKKVQSRDKFIPVPVLNAFIMQQLDKTERGFPLRDFINFRQNVNAFDKSTNIVLIPNF